MKHILLSFLLVAFSAPSFAQQIEPAPYILNTDYLKKSRHQNTAAWILTGAGTVGLLGTFMADLNQSVAGGLTTVFSLGTVEPEYKSLTVPYLLSAASIAGGVSLFVAASKNRKRAMAEGPISYLRLERGSVIKSTGFTTQAFPAVAVRFPL
jgi:Ni/Fe-hydrogenase subunit HybB-like protein